MAPPISKRDLLGISKCAPMGASKNVIINKTRTLLDSMIAVEMKKLVC